MADLLDGLDDEQLATPSLCTGWDVKMVGAHLVSTLADPLRRFILLTARRGSVNRAVDELAQRRARAPVAEITAALRQLASRRMSPPGAGPLDPLADVLIHSGDIRIALGLPFEPERERAAMALDFATGPWRFAFVPRRVLHGLCLRETDTDRTWGAGAEVRGPVAALLMAAAGRDALLELLDGPGVPQLRDRLTTR